MKLRSELENGFYGRHGKKVKVRDSELTLSRAGFVHRGARLWNTLPENIQSETSLAKFKAQVKPWIKANISHKPP